MPRGIIGLITKYFPLRGREPGAPVAQNCTSRPVIVLLRRTAGMRTKRMVLDDLRSDVAGTDAEIKRLGEGRGSNDGSKNHGSKELGHNTFPLQRVCGICRLAHCLTLGRKDV
jgi:hypothetical protein